jgi:16S rRNA (cytosine1407-C5)-methyltransferase
MPEENEGVVDAVLKNSAGRVELLDAQLVLPQPAPGLTSLDDHEFFPGMERTIRLWPHRYQTAGFFACLLRKNESMEYPSESVPARSLDRVGFYPLDDKEIAVFCQRFLDEFGFDINLGLSTNHRILIRRFEEIHLFPALLVQYFADLPLQSAGLLLGQQTPDGFLPSHEWVTRFGASCRNNVVTLDELQSRAWMKGENLPISQTHTATSSRYRVVLNTANQAIGRAKVSSAGLKNLLPRRLL